jgi:hypothetical protein
MASTISGNVGGASASGAQVQCLNIATKQISYGAGDGSGNYTIPNLAAGTYVVSATLGSNVYYHPVQVIADGSSTYSAINLNPVLLNANNVVPQSTNF